MYRKAGSNVKLFLSTFSRLITVTWINMDNFLSQNSWPIHSNDIATVKSNQKIILFMSFQIKTVV